MSRERSVAGRSPAAGTRPMPSARSIELGVDDLTVAVVSAIIAAIAITSAVVGSIAGVIIPTLPHRSPDRMPAPISKGAPR